MSEHDDTQPTGGLADWIGWHLGELLAVGVPAVLAVAVAGWLISLSIAAAAVWSVVEVHHRRDRRELPAAGGPGELTTLSTSESEAEEAHA